MQSNDELPNNGQAAVKHSVSAQAGRSTRFRWFDWHSRTARVVVIGLLSCVFGIMLVRLVLGVPNADLPSLDEAKMGVRVFDRDDKLVCTVHADRDRQPIPLSQMSEHIKNAVIAAEDRRFYQHHGIDPVAIVRACWSNYKQGRIVSGGSTITQQLACNLYFNKNEKSIVRKIKEAFVAWDIDHNYSKDKILETYLNEVYFGGGAFGIERASEHYFNKRADRLTVSEAAYLAGLVRSPSYLTMPQNKKLALSRQHTVLHNMAECGYISEETRRKAQADQLAFKRGPSALPYPYYVGYLMQVVQREVGDDLWKHHWNVYSNLDVKAQQVAEAALTRGIKTAPAGVDQGALVTMSLKDGAVLAMVGGVGEPDGAYWNRAIYPHTAGSAFKPFVYLAALIDGIVQPTTIVDDAPLSIMTDTGELYEPQNYDNRFMGWIPVRSALAYSRNVCAVRVAQDVGINRVVEVAKACGIRSQLDPYLSLALGASAVTPLEMAAAYGTLARSGVYMAPQMVRRIQSTDARKDIPYQATPQASLPCEAVRQLVDAMQDVVRYGTGTRARLSGVMVAGKTGTSDQRKDIWFIGFTPDTVTAVWGGNDKNNPVKGSHVTGGGVMAGIWHDFMTAFYHDHEPPTELVFTPPEQRLASSMPDELAYTQDYATFGANQDPYAPTIEKLAGRGIAKAYDWVKARAMQLWRDSGAPMGTAPSADPLVRTASEPVPDNYPGYWDNRSVRDMVNNVYPDGSVEQPAPPHPSYAYSYGKAKHGHHKHGHQAPKWARKYLGRIKHYLDDIY